MGEGCWLVSQTLHQEWAMVNPGAEGSCLSLSYGAMALFVLCFKTVNNVLLALCSLRCSWSWSSDGLCWVIGIGQYALRSIPHFISLYQGRWSLNTTCSRFW